ncbi:hypothetical protein QQ020_32965 [Fulvivirgaceae bacterium BMA12]|uniref:Outer membrane protein beta-barrel domain-containing protein n=1 Tax=Agaribacillus aureus TaxID=3051825 RepID=A0ABT8LGJ9_9BACT|nr:hypothetical protein [Fulvivirgaceae bacterium BMA12]
MRLFFTCIWFLANPSLVWSQSIELSTGMALPETFNFSARIISSKVIGGISYGFLPAHEESLRTFTGDVGIPFGRMAANAESKRSQVRLGFTYYREETSSRIFKNWYSNLRVGRNYFFSKQLGLGLEGGMTIRLSEKTERKDGFTGGSSFQILDDFLPSLSIRFFYRPS